LRTDTVNAIAEAIRHAPPAANSPQVSAVTLPLRGSMQCFTPITESPSIAATSTARAPPGSSADSASARWTRRGSRARSSGSDGARCSIGGGGVGRALRMIITSPVACSAEAATVPASLGAGPGRALPAITSPAANGAVAATVPASLGPGPGRALPAITSPAANGAEVATTPGTRGEGSGGGVAVRAAGAASRVMISPAASVGGPAGAAIGAARSIAAAPAIAAAMASPIDSSMRVAPSSITSPDSSRALLIFLPLTNVPRAEPRSIRLTSWPVISTIACIRLTASSSIRRWADGTLPILITPWVSVSCRISWPFWKMRNDSASLA
jgi:hypothetical protein